MCVCVCVCISMRDVCNPLVTLSTWRRSRIQEVEKSVQSATWCTEKGRKDHVTVTWSQYQLWPITLFSLSQNACKAVTRPEKERTQKLQKTVQLTHSETYMFISLVYQTNQPTTCNQHEKGRAWQLFVIQRWIYQQRIKAHELCHVENGIQLFQ